ncbi:MAG: hypothetical protein GAK45_00572 [Pseudomonas citronellolis]|nr:MAG: hypothetical protein GAK45_00572 [Pseudomonas citronellolis]
MSATKRGQKPAHLAMAGGKSPRQHMWEAIRRDRQGFTVYGIARRSEQDDGAVISYLTGLRRAGYIEPVRTFAKDEEITFHLVRDNGVEAPAVDAKGKPTRKGYVAEAMWRTLRILGRATPEQIAAQVAATGAQVLPASVERYFRDLMNAGYLQRDGRHYILPPKRYTGPRAPMVQRSTQRQVYDPNLDKIVWIHGQAPAQLDPQELAKARIEIEHLAARAQAAAQLLEDWIQLSSSKDRAQCSLAVATRAFLQPQPLELHP